MTMIERVARAIWAVEYDAEAYPFETASKAEKNLLNAQARAAIEAMREPTAEMLNAPGTQTNCQMCGGHAEGWHLWIKAALAETNETKS